MTHKAKTSWGKGILNNLYTRIRRPVNSRGMTFVEILVVLTIIAGIAALGITNYMSQLDKAKVKQAKIFNHPYCGGF